MLAGDGRTLDQVVQAMVSEGVSRGSNQIRIAVRGDDLEASYFDGEEFRVGVVVPAHWFGRVERQLKLMANILLTDPRLPQEGWFKRSAVVRGGSCELEVALSTSPSAADDTILLTVQNVRWAGEAADPTMRLL